jgi:hypothetical protein
MDMSGSIEHAVSSYFSQWLAQHPYLAWSIGHPLPSLGLVLVAILLLWGLIKAIGRGVEQIWIFLLKTPFKLLQPIFSRIWGSIWRRLGNTSYTTDALTNDLAVKPAHSNVPERVDLILDRLHALNQEQQILLGELSTLANSPLRKSLNRSRSDTQ